VERSQRRPAEREGAPWDRPGSGRKVATEEKSQRSASESDERPSRTTNAKTDALHRHGDLDRTGECGIAVWVMGEEIE
jgi:hypothetical protein